MSKLICFDLEGPLSPQDNAFEVMGLIPSGHDIFSAISRYDDLLTLEQKPDYEPGDTLALIVPFLIYHELKENAITEVSKKAMLVDGARDLVSGLKEAGWNVFTISTSYEQHALNIGSQVGVDEGNIYCTRFPLSRFKEELEDTDLSIVADVEQQLMELMPVEGKDEQLKEILDKFYWVTISETHLGEIIYNLNVVGGQRKVDAALEIANTNNCSLGDIAVVGDSITDFKMLQEVNNAGGFAVAFNANDYAIPYATISMASENLNNLKPALFAWEEGGVKSAIEKIAELMEAPDRGDRYYFHDLSDRENYDDILQIHKKYRALVRGAAAKLG